MFQELPIYATKVCRVFVLTRFFHDMISILMIMYYINII